MSAEAPALTCSWPVGRFTVTLTVPRADGGALASAVVEWHPEQPDRLTPAEVAQYRAGRNAAIKALGVTAVVIEV